MLVTCPGPRARVPCVGMLGHCPLAEGADAVVLDPLLEGDRLVGSIPGLQVLEVYLRMGLGVVLVGGPSEFRKVRGRPGVVPVPRPADYGTLVGAVRDALALSRVHRSDRREEGG